MGNNISFGQSSQVRKHRNFGTAALPSQLITTTTTSSIPPLQQSCPLRHSPVSCSAEVVLRAPFPFVLSIKVDVERQQQTCSECLPCLVSPHSAGRSCHTCHSAWAHCLLLLCHFSRVKWKISCGVWNDQTSSCIQELLFSIPSTLLAGLEEMEIWHARASMNFRLSQQGKSTFNFQKYS